MLDGLRRKRMICTVTRRMRQEALFRERPISHSSQYQICCVSRAWRIDLRI